MRKISKSPGKKIVKAIKRATRKQCPADEKIRIVLNGLQREDSMKTSAVSIPSGLTCSTTAPAIAEPMFVHVAVVLV